MTDTGHASGKAAERPNILVFHVDNFGFGELSCYSGGPFPGAWTERIDAFASEGTRLTSYVPESQCTPTRSALLTGRHAIRSGTHSVPLGVPGGWGLVAWERTLGDLLSDAGYACAAYGKWHVGEGPGRWPTDHGFAEWNGPPRTYDEALWPDDPWYEPGRDPVTHMLEIKRGDEDVTELDQLTLDVRRDCDAEYLRRAEAFIRASAADDAPFFVYFNHSLLHMPVIPRAEFRRASGNGDWADCLLELDGDFGTLLDLLDTLDVADNTLVVFAGDNGPEEVLTWRGSPGYWEGSYFAGGEGNLRTPCIVRWPGEVLTGRVSNDIMHVADWFTTVLGAAGVDVPADRVIDGVDQLPWLRGHAEHSARDGYAYWMGAELYGARWRNFKLVLVEQKHSTDPVAKLSAPKIINLLTDPHEREPFDLPYLHSRAACALQPDHRSVRSQHQGGATDPRSRAVGLPAQRSRSIIASMTMSHPSYQSRHNPKSDTDLHQGACALSLGCRRRTDSGARARGAIGLRRKGAVSCRNDRQVRAAPPEALGRSC